jgi:hypothetical protein
VPGDRLLDKQKVAPLTRIGKDIESGVADVWQIAIAVRARGAMDRVLLRARASAERQARCQTVLSGA